MKKKINLFCDLRPNLVFGWLGREYALALHEAGWDVHIQLLTQAVDHPEVKVDPTVAKWIRPEVPNVPRVVAHHMGHELGQNVRAGDILFTVWETTKIPKTWIEYIKRARCVITPSTFSAATLRRCGIKAPVCVVEHGVDTDVFCLSQTTLPRKVFLTAGRSVHGRVRKGLDAVVYAFVQAFGTRSDVCLWVKSHKDCHVLNPHQDNVQIISAFLPPLELARLYQESFCFVSGACGEGWGMHQHESMACGKALISIPWGGVMDYFRPGRNGLPLEYDIRPTSQYFANEGVWAVPRIESLAEQMLWASEHVPDIYAMGLQAHLDVSKFDLPYHRKEFASVVARYA